MSKKLVVPMYSMRSYKSDRYSILKDGNFQLAMSRALADGFYDHIDFAVPDNAVDLDEAREFFEGPRHEGSAKTLSLVPIRYGKNAHDTRKTLWQNFSDSASLRGYSLVLTDVSGFHGLADLPPVECNFNVSKSVDVSRPLVDEFFESDLAAVRAATRTTVLNEGQKKAFVEADPSLESKVFVDVRVLNPKYYERIGVYKLDPKGPRGSIEFRSNTIFWPFRVSDPGYKLDEFLQAIAGTFLQVVFTDPNQSLDRSKLDDLAISSTVLNSLTKLGYYKFLQERPIVVMLDDVDVTFHPGTAEFIYFKCPLIHYRNSLFNTEFAIERDKPLAQELDRVLSRAFEKSKSEYWTDEDGVKTLVDSSKFWVEGR